MPSDKVLSLKKDVVDEIAENIKKSSAVVFVSYRGLTVAELSNLRNKLRDSNSEIKIYKNTLTKRALEKLDIKLEDACFEGPNALAFSGDSVEPIKIISEFAKNNKALELRIGIVEGIITDKNTLHSIATLPSREGLLTMLAGGLLGVVRDMAICLNLIAEKANEES
jgi:large subunit ribosomal protein L10